MKTNMVALALAIGLGLPASAAPTRSDLTGDWISLANDATPFPMIMHVLPGEVRLDSPDRGGIDEKVVVAQGNRPYKKEPDKPK